MDIAVEVVSEVEEQRLLDLKYLKIGNKWYTPRWKVDIYRRDVGGFPIDQIARDAVQIHVRRSHIRVANLEMLILMKHRAGQTADVRNLVGNKFSSITWNYMQSIARDSLEVEEMKNVARSLGLLK